MLLSFGDWPRCQIRRHWLNVIRNETGIRGLCLIGTEKWRKAMSPMNIPCRREQQVQDERENDEKKEEVPLVCLSSSSLRGWFIAYSPVLLP
jgi:hypothetical protein